MSEPFHCFFTVLALAVPVLPFVRPAAVFRGHWYAQAARVTFALASLSAVVALIGASV